MKSDVAAVEFTTLQIQMKPIGGSVEVQNDLLPLNTNADKVITIMCDTAIMRRETKIKKKNPGLSALH